MITLDHLNSDIVICENDRNFDFLVRLSNITQGPLLERRKEIRKSFVLAALSIFSPESIFQVKDLYDNVKKITRCELDNENIISILNELESEEIVRHLSGLEYQLKKKIEIPDFQQKSQPVWDEFYDFLKNHYKDFDPFIDKDARKVFDCILIELLKRFIISSEPLEHQVESLPIEDFDLLIQEEANKANLSKNLDKVYPNIINTYIHSDSKVFLQFVFENYSNQINIDLITREQEMPFVDFLDDVNFLLVDTPFLTALMCKTDSIHPLAAALAKQCEKSNIPLYYSSKTKNEMFGLISGSKYEMKGLSSRKRGIFSNQFVADFKRQKISWNDYLIKLESWEQFIELHYQIKLTPASFDVEVDEELYNYIYKVTSLLDMHRNHDRAEHIPDYQPRLRGELQLKHDAFCISLIAKFRKNMYSDGKKSIGPWFLTFDSLLTYLNETNFRQQNDYGYVIQPRILLNWLLIFSKIQFDDEDKKLVAEAIIKFTARSRENKITLPDYTRLITYKFGLDEKDILIMEEIFLASPLRAELENALDLDHAEDADLIAAKVVSDDKFVETIVGEHRTREKLKNVADILRRTKEDLGKERAAKEALERIQKQSISITANITANIDISIKNEVISLITFLEAENAFKNGQLEKPSDISTTGKLIKWLEGIKATIETSKTMSEGAKALLPIISYLLMKSQAL